MAWYTSILNVAESAAGWMESNPTAASIITGAVSGGAQYYANKENQKEVEKREERLYERRKEEKAELSGGSSGIGNYGSHNSKLTGGTGLLTNGIFTGKK